ncbi:Ankyrin repeat [Musa troglodytarum]|uniref:Ankyrin repeat n=1 Tax=Musa troglodytarum TaxID=320322 RepID=A0A9E7HNZ1_9LILI|nr:Ankyrin repeat [Musa troglodytarum]
MDRNGRLPRHWVRGKAPSWHPSGIGGDRLGSWIIPCATLSMEDRPDSGEPGWIDGKRAQHDVVKGVWLLAAGRYVERVLRGIIFGKSLLSGRNLGLHMLLKDLGILSNKRQSLL